METENEMTKHDLNLNKLSEKYEDGMQKLKQSLEKLKESIERLSSFTEDMKTEN